MAMAAPSSIMVTGSRISREEADATGQAQTTSPDLRYVPSIVIPTVPDRERYDGKDVSEVAVTLEQPVSTFSVDVDTGAYSNARRMLTDGQLPPKGAVRTEEFVNYFRYDYPRPTSAKDAPFTVNMDVARTPWDADTRLVRIGLAGYEAPKAERPAANLVFLLDVSGSMSSADKLPLVKTAMKTLVGQLTPKDRVSIVVYAGAAGLVLEPTSDSREIMAALDQLQAGGSTAGGAGLELAYKVAEASKVDGINRVILATDGDFNVGLSDNDALLEYVEDKRKNGIAMSVLGFGTGNINEALMEQIADKGNGNYGYIDSAIEARKVLGEQLGATLYTIAKDVKIQVEFNPAVISQYRLIGYENRILREQDFDNDAVDAGDIGSGHQVTAIYEVVPASAEGWIPERRYQDKIPQAASDKATEAAFVKLRYKQPDGDTSTLITEALPARMLAAAPAPSGDFAFATSVAAFAQKLRGDTLLDDYDYAAIRALAGPQRDFYRQEFLKLVGVAEGLDQE
ncbi:von Willebrand factor type A domain-containing protein [Erythrobacter sp. YJ-T3-07]|nr:von Willebrand factor type A domain-containing protein [Erythrobacter sp. YJ-T3-07]